jgi:ribosome-binding protein aMBF1 (putative translation factor)
MTRAPNRREAGGLRPISWRPQVRRPNPVFGEDYDALRRALIRARRRAGLSQRQLAAAIGRAQSHIGLIERGQRRVDALEMYYFAKAMGFPPLALFAEIVLHLEGRPGAAGEDDPSGGAVRG